MKRKLLIILLALATVFCCALSLAACGDNANSNNTTNNGNQTEQGGNNSQIHEHSYSERIIAPTCTEQGYTLHSCSCGESYIDNYKDALGHTEVIDEAVEATCSETGLTEGRHCSVCNIILIEQKIILAYGHSPVIDIAINATCTKTGLTEGKHCAVCNEVLVQQELVNSIGHKFIDGYCISCGAKSPTEGLQYVLNNDENSYSVVGIGTAKDTNIVIANTFEGLPVTSIGSKAFYDCRSITGITIPENISEIGREAFYNCTSLAEINFNSFDCYNSGGWDNEVFYNAGKNGNGIKVNIGKNVRRIPSYLFCPINNSSSNSYDPYIVSIIFEDDSECESIGVCAFSHCSSLKAINLPKSVISIGVSPFFFCTNLESINVEKNNPVYQSINNCILETESKTLIVGCKNSIIPDDGSVTSIGDYAFEGCISLANITIPNKITSIGYMAFQYCRSLENIVIPDSVNTIDSHAFSKSALKNITFGNGITSIGSQPFLDTNIKNIYISDIAAWCRIPFSTSQYSSPCYTAKNLYINGELVTNLIIPEGVESIGNYAFYELDTLNSITLPKSLNSIGEYAFNRNKLLESISVSDQNTKFYSSGNCLIDITTKSVVLGCKNSVIPLNDNILSIADYAFEFCVSIESLIIPDSVKSIGRFAFYACYLLENINFGEGVNMIGDYAFDGCTSLKVISLPDSITKIGTWAFNGCSKLSDIYVGEGLISVDSNAFYNCRELKRVYISNLEKWCNIEFSSRTASTPFYYASELYLNNNLVNELYIPVGVKIIKNNTFENCTSIKSIFIPNSVEKIGNYAFANNAILNIYYYGTSSDWENINIGSNNTAITSASLYYYSEDNPTVDSNYWHYVDGEVVIWAKED